MTISLPVINNSSKYDFSKIKSLLTTKGNTKLDKTRKSQKVMIGSLSLRPAMKVKDNNGKVILNTCAWSSSGCRAICVTEQCGCNTYSNVRDIRNLKTEFLAHDPVGFINLLKKDLRKLVEKRDNLAKKTKKKKQNIFVRLNTSSDYEWEKHESIFTEFPEINFYDYTKGVHRFNKKLPKNYQLTYSKSELSKEKDIEKVLDSGNNVAIVVSKTSWAGKMESIPKFMMIGKKKVSTVDGDVSDIRISSIPNSSNGDGKGNIIVLRSKGGQHKLKNGLKSGFIVKV